MSILLQVGVKALLKNKDGKYLLLRRSKKKYSNIQGYWDIPGGRIEPGTTLYENLQREIYEETKLELKDEIKLIHATDILRIPGRHVVRLTYTSTIIGTPEIDPEEVEAYGWFTLEELKNHDDLDIYTKKLLDQFII